MKMKTTTKIKIIALLLGIASSCIFFNLGGALCPKYLVWVEDALDENYGKEKTLEEYKEKYFITQEEYQEIRGENGCCK